MKVTTSLTDASYIASYAAIRREVLGDVRPAFMVAIVSGLIKPGVVVEVEAIAAG